MEAWVGTSGFSYKEWKGGFYPRELPAGEMLCYYGERLRAVEINNTFYRMPSKKVLAGWAGQVPEGFTFALKASRRITHQKRLKEVEGELGYLLGNAAELGGRLGPILYQLPPYLKKDLGRLEAFLALLPPGSKAAVEFRSSSWFDGEVYEALRGAGAALVAADMGEEEPPVVPTASFGYARLRRGDYGPADLERWAARLAEQPWEEVYVFFKHEEKATGPRLAQEFAGLLQG